MSATCADIMRLFEKQARKEALSLEIERIKMKQSFYGSLLRLIISHMRPSRCLRSYLNKAPLDECLRSASFKETAMELHESEKTILECLMKINDLLGSSTFQPLARFFLPAIQTSLSNLNISFVLIAYHRALLDLSSEV